MAQHKGNRLLQGRIGTGRGGMQKLQDIQEELAMGSEERQQEGQVIVPGIAQMGFTLRTDGLGLRADQGVDRLEPLLWGARWPASP